jgi:LysM repeat protein
MKKQLFRFILTGFLQLSFVTLAQTNSYPVTLVNGKEYYQYTVQPGEGLLAISRKFDISVDEISKATPEVKDGLKAGQQVLIPVPKKAGKKLFGKSNPTPDFIQYKVGKKQTLFSICRKFKVNEEDVLKYNPAIKDGLQEGTILQIPKFSTEKVKVDNDAHVNTNSQPAHADKSDTKPTFKTHIVKESETLFAISKRYKVDILDIIKSNPGCDTKLVVGSELKIPIPVKTKGQKKENIALDVKTTKVEPKIIEKPVVKVVEKKNIKIAFLLPLMLDQPKNDPSVERFINFYEGALLAINEAKQHGISFEIYTYDTEKSEDRVKEILNNPELKTVDLIIGPAFSNQVPIVEDFSKENKINTLIPFTSKIPDIDSNPYLFQFNPGQDSELELISDLIMGKYKNAHIIFAELPGISPLDDGRIRVEALQKKLTKEHKSFSKIELGTSENMDITSVLKKGAKNIVIFNSDKFSNVSPFLSSLEDAKPLDIILFKQYSWRNQSEKIPQGIFISPFLMKYNPSLVNEFNLEYDQYFGKDVTADSPRYDLLGYDLSRYFITLIRHNGGKFGSKINSNNLEKGIQSEPLFERSSNNSGFINQRVYLGEDQAQ